MNGSKQMVGQLRTKITTTHQIVRNNLRNLGTTPFHSIVAQNYFSFWQISYALKLLILHFYFNETK